MKKVYHVLNDYSLEELNQEEYANWEKTKQGLKERIGKVNYGKAKMYRNRYNELVYVSPDHFEDLEGYQL
tara:strand:+ start:34497 stop:34706 length:210 start_codon:yes stop_codon:yes gene_type:complete